MAPRRRPHFLAVKRRAFVPRPDDFSNDASMYIELFPTSKGVPLNDDGAAAEDDYNEDITVSTEMAPPATTVGTTNPAVLNSSATTTTVTVIASTTSAMERPATTTVGATTTTIAASSAAAAMATTTVSTTSTTPALELESSSLAVVSSAATTAGSEDKEGTADANSSSIALAAVEPTYPATAGTVGSESEDWAMPIEPAGTTIPTVNISEETGEASPPAAPVSESMAPVLVPAVAAPTAKANVLEEVGAPSPSAALVTEPLTTAPISAFSYFCADVFEPPSSATPSGGYDNVTVIEEVIHFDYDLLLATALAAASLDAILLRLEEQLLARVGAALHDAGLCREGNGGRGRLLVRHRSLVGTGQKDDEDDDDVLVMGISSLPLDKVIGNASCFAENMPSLTESISLTESNAAAASNAVACYPILGYMTATYIYGGHNKNTVKGATAMRAAILDIIQSDMDSNVLVDQADLAGTAGIAGVFFVPDRNESTEASRENTLTTNADASVTFDSAGAEFEPYRNDTTAASREDTLATNAEADVASDINHSVASSHDDFLATMVDLGVDYVQARNTSTDRNSSAASSQENTIESFLPRSPAPLTRHDAEEGSIAVAAGLFAALAALLIGLYAIQRSKRCGGEKSSRASVHLEGEDENNDNLNNEHDYRGGGDEENTSLTMVIVPSTIEQEQQQSQHQWLNKSMTTDTDMTPYASNVGSQQWIAESDTTETDVTEAVSNTICNAARYGETRYNNHAAATAPSCLVGQTIQECDEDEEH